MTGLRAALACSACCCERGTEVGPRDGEPKPLRAGLVGMDRVVSLPRARLWDKNLDLFEDLAGPRRPGAGNPAPSLMYLVLFYVNLSPLSSQFSTHLFPCFFASSSARELCSAASAASVPAVSEAGLELEVVFVLVLVFGWFAAFAWIAFVGLNLIFMLRKKPALSLGSTLMTPFFGLACGPGKDMLGEFEEDEFGELLLRKRSYVKGS